MATAVARQGEPSLRGSDIAPILMPPVIALLVLVALDASLRRSIPLVGPGEGLSIDAVPRGMPGPASAAVPGSARHLGATTPEVVAGRSDGNAAPPGLVLPPGSLAAARVRLQALAAAAHETPDGARPASSNGDARVAALPLPPPRPDVAPLAGAGGADPRPAAVASYDRQTAVYEIASHTVYLPDGSRLEAHSGFGPDRDDPRSVGARMRGATPPNVYAIKPLDKLFHGVRALRLDPVGDGNMFGRDGMLAHTYMLGPKGDSNGCVVFKDYKAFLKAWDGGMIKSLAVVAKLG